MRASLPPRLLAGSIVAAAIVFAALRLTGGASAPPPLGSLAIILPPTVAPATYADALRRSDARLAVARADAARNADQWLPLETLALVALDRARLTGNYSDYAIADEALRRAFALAPERAGPHLTRAALDFQLHRLAPAEASLDAIGNYAVPEPAEIQSEADAVRGDILFYRGRYREALGHYERADTLAPGAGIAVRRAVLHAATGAPREAAQLIDRAARVDRFTTPQAVASLMLQRGGIALQRGDWDTAEEEFARAARQFPGHWLIDSHVAQMRAARGDQAGAITAYEAILARTPNPETMDALAALHRARGDFAAARRWADRARPLWEERLKRFPEAAYAHAFEHHLNFGDPATALDLARRNFAARPHGGAATALGWALLANGRAAEALRVLNAVNASHWISAEQHVAAAQAHALLGDGKAAEAERDKALALNPRILDPASAMIWFGH